ncbi:MAG: hypothetical protein Q4D65_09145 [Peptostreptococcaceae bacterium]|nr:hypothetical protein [Peptostreptococcaceae bacterium]
MSKTMSTLLVAIAQALDKEFGNIRIETGEVPQAFEVPAFYIAPLDLSRKPEVNQRYWKENTFVITYFPEESENALELADAAERSMRALDVIDDSGSLIRAKDIEIRIQDGVAVITAEYHAYVKYIDSDKTLMERLAQSRK